MIYSSQKPLKGFFSLLSVLFPLFSWAWRSCTSPSFPDHSYSPSLHTSDGFDFWYLLAMFKQYPANTNAPFQFVTMFYLLTQNILEWGHEPWVLSIFQQYRAEYLSTVSIYIAGQTVILHNYIEALKAKRSDSIPSIMKDRSKIPSPETEWLPLSADNINGPMNWLRREQLPM